MTRGDFATSLAVIAVIATVSAASSPSPALAKKPLDITDSDFAQRVRQATADKIREPNSAPKTWATTTPEVIVTPRFVYVRDRGLTLPAPPWFGEGAYAAAFELVRSAWFSAQPDKVRAIIVFSTFDDGGTALFYLAMANDIFGLGAGQPAGIFDDTPDSVLDGFAWMGDVDELESAGDAYFREAFIHEIAHRWSSYAQINHRDLPRDFLLGRQKMHWSYFADTMHSPMEGNAWKAEGQNIFVTDFATPPVFRFSPLDLYLMGVLPAERVPPFSVLKDFEVLEPAMAVTAESAPAHRSGTPVRGRAGSVVEISVQDVIGGSGVRVPPAMDEPIVWPVGIVLLSNGLDRLRIEELVRLDQHIAELVRDFEAATGGRITLDVDVLGAGTSEFGEPCSRADECDRTRADSCEPIREGGTPVCTRTCEATVDCGPGFCCGTLPSEESSMSASGQGTRSICLAGARCTMGTKDPMMPGGAKPDAGTPGPGALDTDASKTGCACAVSAGRKEDRAPATAWAFALALGLALASRRQLSAVRRSSSDRTCSRASSARSPRPIGRA